MMDDYLQQLVAILDLYIICRSFLDDHSYNRAKESSRYVRRSVESI